MQFKAFVLVVGPYNSECRQSSLSKLSRTSQCFWKLKIIESIMFYYVTTNAQTVEKALFSNLNLTKT